MKIVLPVTFDIDPAVWATDYGLTAAEAPADILDVLTRAAAGDLADAIVAGWRMMADHTITVGEPGTVLTALAGDEGIDLAAEVARLDSAERDRLARTLRDLDSEQARAAILARVREVIALEFPEADDLPAPVGVVFTPAEYDDGFYLTDEGTVYLADGTSVPVNFPDLDSDLFTDEFGRSHDRFSLTVDLRTGTIDTHDHIAGADHFTPATVG